MMPILIERIRAGKTVSIEMIDEKNELRKVNLMSHGIDEDIVIINCIVRISVQNIEYLNEESSEFKT